MSDRIFELLLARDGVLVLERKGPKSFRPRGSSPEWLSRCFRPAQIEVLTREPGEVFHFVDHFLDDAEAWWARGESGDLRSEPWTESAVTGEEIAMEACACLVEGHCYLILRGLGAEFARTQRVLQTGRELALAHERLQGETSKKEILLHCIVHDLNGPLSGITSAFDLLEHEKLSKEGLRILGLGRHAALQQSNFISDLLDTFRAEVSTLETVSTNAAACPDIVSTAASVIEALAPVSDCHETPIHIVLGPGTGAPLRVIAERNRLERIFYNLLQNAHRHSPRRSEIIITITREGDEVFVSVDDSGGGISPRVAPHLFQKFIRGKGHSGKAGLGLYFCRITVEQWGGKIGFESRQEGGTRFWFRLKCA